MLCISGDSIFVLTPTTWLDGRTASLATSAARLTCFCTCRCTWWRDCSATSRVAHQEAGNTEMGGWHEASIQCNYINFINLRFRMALVNTYLLQAIWLHFPNICIENQYLAYLIALYLNFFLLFRFLLLASCTTNPVIVRCQGYSLFPRLRFVMNRL